MRNTSERRTARPRGVAYQGSPGIPKRDSLEFPKFKEEPGPDTVCCPDCGVYVKRLSNGRPRRHAAGGYSPAKSTGRRPCESSGSGPKVSHATEESGKPVYTGSQAAAKRLVTPKMIVEKYRVSMTTLMKWSDLGTFPAYVGWYFERGRPQRLYHADAVVSFFKGKARHQPEEEAS